jgi:hypothetical protein
MFSTLNTILNTNKHLFQFAFQHKNHIWTHGGIHRGWWEHRFKKYKTDIVFDTIADELNYFFNAKEFGIYNQKIESLFDCGFDRGGSETIGGPLWVDRKTLINKGIRGYHQIVGHNKVPKLITHGIKKKKEITGSITFCDCLDITNEFYRIEI